MSTDSLDNIIELFTPGEIQAATVFQSMVDEIRGEGAMLYHEGHFICTERELCTDLRDDWLEHIRRAALIRVRSRLNQGGPSH